MKIKFPFKNSFFHRIYFYLIFAILIPIFTCAAIELRTTPSKQERVNIFISADLKATSTLSSSIWKYFEGYNDRIINVACCDYKNDYFASRYGSEGLLSDVLILSENALSQVDTSLYATIPVTNEFYGPTNYIKDEKHIGIYFGNGESSPFSKDVSYRQENYYAFVSSNTVHGKYFLDDFKDDQIFVFLKRVFDEGK